MNKKRIIGVSLAVFILILAASFVFLLFFQHSSDEQNSGGIEEIPEEANLEIFKNKLSQDYPGETQLKQFKDMHIQTNIPTGWKVEELSSTNVFIEKGEYKIEFYLREGIDPNGDGGLIDDRFFQYHLKLNKFGTDIYVPVFDPTEENLGQYPYLQVVTLRDAKVFNAGIWVDGNSYDIYINVPLEGSFSEDTLIELYSMIQSVEYTSN